MLDRRILWLMSTIFRRRYAKIGFGSYLGPTLFVKTRRHNLHIGNNVRIMAAARLEVLGKGQIKISRHIGAIKIGSPVPKLKIIF